MKYIQIGEKTVGNTILCFNCEQDSEILNTYSDSNGDKTDT